MSCYAETRGAGRGARLPHVPLAVVQRLQTQDAGEAAEQLAASEEPDEAQRREAAQLEALPRLVGVRGGLRLSGQGEREKASRAPRGAGSRARQPA